MSTATLGEPGGSRYEVFDEHLLGIYEKPAAAGYPQNQLQPFARLLNAVSRAGSP